MYRVFEKLAAAAQVIVPQHLLTAWVHRLMRIEMPAVKNVQIRIISRLAGVDWSEAASANLSDYATFNAFFTRSLKPGVRAFDQQAHTLASPCDGRISELGRIEADQLFQAKGRRYSLQALLGDDSDCSAWEDGCFFTIYLSPRDYHRVHMPMAGVLQRMTYIPGKLFSVAPYTVRHVDHLFARNERVVSVFETAVGPLGLVLVGAMLVAGMETVWAGEITPATKREIRTTRYPPAGDGAVRLAKGAEMGRFNMGSTIILLLPPGAVQQMQALAGGDRVQLGQTLATLGQVSASVAAPA
jgi:phosphatidylserine decarboxylase